MASLLIIAACVYTDSFRFISDSPFEGKWKAAAVCTVALAVEFAALVWPVRNYPSLAGRGLLVLVMVTGLGATGLAIFAGWHATQGLGCFGAAVHGFSPTASEVQQVDAQYRTLSIVDTLAVLACLATAVLVVLGAVLLAIQSAVRPFRAR